VTVFHALSQVHDYGLGLLALVWILAVRPRRVTPGAGGTDAGSRGDK
jgi:hypothetical protein